VLAAQPTAPSLRAGGGGSSRRVDGSGGGSPQWTISSHVGGSPIRERLSPAGTASSRMITRVGPTSPIGSPIRSRSRSRSPTIQRLWSPGTARRVSIVSPTTTSPSSSSIISGSIISSGTSSPYRAARSPARRGGTAWESVHLGVQQEQFDVVTLEVPRSEWQVETVDVERCDRNFLFL
jgi:hypothetical protein